MEDKNIRKAYDTCVKSCSATYKYISAAADCLPLIFFKVPLSSYTECPWADGDRGHPPFVERSYLLFLVLVLKLFLPTARNSVRGVVVANRPFEKHSCFAFWKAKTAFGCRMFNSAGVNYISGMTLVYINVLLEKVSRRSRSLLENSLFFSNRKSHHTWTYLLLFRGKINPGGMNKRSRNKSVCLN